MARRRLRRPIVALIYMVSAASAASAAAGAADPEPRGDDIVVTGTQITRRGYTAPAPVTRISADDLLRNIPSSLPDALNLLPQLLMSASPSRSTHNFASSGNNGNILNLRGVGGIRSLILFDGARVAPTTYLGNVDVDVLPELLISHVDIVLGGASAGYGSDAISGVVNFVLDRDYSGVKGILQGGISQRGDNANHRIGVAGGFDLPGENGHVLLSAETSENGGMRRDQRAAGRQGYAFSGSTGVGAPGSATNPYAIFRDVRLTSASDFGTIVGPAGSPFLNLRFGADGSLAPFNNGTPTGSEGFATGGDGFAIPPAATAIAPHDTRQLFARLDRDLSASVHAFLQATYASNDLSYTSLANSFVAPTAATLFSGNPYLPPIIQRGLGPADSIVVARYGGSEPQPHTDERTTFWTARTGLSGATSGGWTWALAYSHGQSRQDVAQQGVWDWRRTYAALDAVRDGSGNIVCRASIDADPAVRERFAGCRPLNILINGSAFTAQPGYAYAVGTARYRAAIAEDDATLRFGGSPVSLPGGPVDLAIGAELRRQSLRLTSNGDPSLLDSAAEQAAYFAGVRGVPAGTPAYWLTDVAAARGQVRVGEAFVEINIPLFDRINVNGGARIADYSTTGMAFTWKVTAGWNVMESVKIHGTLSRDIRSPSLYELFAGPQAGIGLLVDPRSGLTGNVASEGGGNSALKPERGHSLTLGPIVSPAFLPGLNIAIDYYRLKIAGLIGTLSISQIAQDCFASQGRVPECALIDQPDPTRLPVKIRTVPANIAFLETSGVDIDASYRTPAPGGLLALRLTASYLAHYRSQQSATAPVLDFAGYGQAANQPTGYPRWRGTLTTRYDRDRFAISLAEQYISPVKIGSPEPNQNFGGLKTPSIWYTNLTLSRSIRARGGNAELFMTIDNLFDRAAPLVPGTTPGLNLPTIISLYDTVGRAFTAGVRVSF